MHLLDDAKGLVSAIVFEKSGLPPDFSITATQTRRGAVKGSIAIVDPLLPVVRERLNGAFAFLRCMFDAEIALDRVKIDCDAESPEEEELIPVKSFSISTETKELPLSFDFISRSIMAAESFHPPHYEAELISASREALSKRRFIDAFRYAFLLLESIHGNGKFRSASLVGEFKNSDELIAAIGDVCADWSTAPIKVKTSDTFAFVSGGASAGEIVEHIVEKRGHYFHGNIKKQNAWKPHEQDEAEALAWLCVSIAMKIAFKAADPIFQQDHTDRHFRQALEVGAIIVIKAVCKFRIPEDDFIRSTTINVNCPGSKPHTLMLMKIVPLVLEKFEMIVPLGRLHSIVAKDVSGDDILNMRFPTEPDGIEIESK